MKRKRWICVAGFVLASLAAILIGCAGVMNEYDRDAAQAHYKAQEALLKAIATQLSQPACRVSGATGEDFKLECYAGHTGIADLKITQYQQPEHPASAIAKGLGKAIEIAPTVAGGTIVGVQGLRTIGKVAESAGGTTYNQTVSGGSSGTIRASGNINTGDIGDGSTIGGQIDTYDSGNTTNTTTTSTTTTDDHTTTTTTPVEP